MTSTNDAAALVQGHIVAGLVGAIVGLRWAPGLTWWERCLNVAAGFSCAAYITPLAAHAFALVAPSVQSGLGFLLGMLGLSLCNAAVTGIRDLQAAEIMRSWLSRPPKDGQ